MTRKNVTIIIGIALFINIFGMVFANNYTSQTVTFNVQAINEIATFGTPIIKDIRNIVRNSQSLKTINATSTYSITTNETNKKITGFIQTELPDNASLIVSLEAPANATSVGDVALTSQPCDLVTGVTRVAESGKLITYQFIVPESQPVNAKILETVVLTITN